MDSSGRNATTVGLDIGAPHQARRHFSRFGRAGPDQGGVHLRDERRHRSRRGHGPGHRRRGLQNLMASAASGQKDRGRRAPRRDHQEDHHGRMKEAEAREVIRWEAEQHCRLTWTTSRSTPDPRPRGEGLQMNVSWVAAKRELGSTRSPSLSTSARGQRDRRDAFALHTRLEITIPRRWWAWSAW